MVVQPLYPQLGIAVGIPIMIVFTVALLLAYRPLMKRHRAGLDAYLKRYSFYRAENYGYDDSSWGMGALMTRIIGLCLALATLLVMVFGLIPFNPKYWAEYGVQGQVAGISNQLASHDGDISGIYYSIAFKGDGPRIYTTDDTRASSVKAGDEVALLCKRSWHFNADDTWDCRIRNFGYVVKVTR